MVRFPRLLIIRANYLTKKLTDMLEEFSATKISDEKKATLPQTTTTTTTAESSTKAAATVAPTETKTGDEGEVSEEDFAKQLQAGMADLLGDMEKSVSN